MDKPDPPAEAPKPPIASFVDPVVAARVILLEAEYLKAQAAAIAACTAVAGGTQWDLSPLGR